MERFNSYLNNPNKGINSTNKNEKASIRKISSNEMDLKNDKLKCLLKEVLYNSLAQAFIKIFSTPHFILKLFLLICVTTSSCLVSYLVIQAILTYLNYGVTTTSRIIFETPALFPKVTICNVNAFATRYAFNLTQQGIFNGNNLTTEQKKKLGHDLNDVLIECWFNKSPCYSTNFTWSFHRTYGNCYAFNSGIDSNGNKVDLSQSAIFGLDYGLQLKIYVNIYEELINFEESLGAVIRIGNSSYSTYYSNDGIFVSPGSNTYIVVDREFKSILPKPYSNCEVESNSPKLRLNLDVYNLIGQSNYAYTQQLCFMQCYQNFVIKRYNCSLYSFFSLFNVTPCDSHVEKLISLYSDDSFNSYFINKNCISVCPLECTQRVYKTSISFSQFNGNSILTSQIMNNSQLVSDFIKRTLDSSVTIRESFVNIWVYYQSLSYTESSESTQMDIVSLLASIGGNMGLFLGVSFFSLFEIVELAIEIYYTFKKK